VILLSGYQLIALATFIWITFFDPMPSVWWRQAVTAAVNCCLSEIWPAYWIILRPLFGA
jgi:hypothetical protein